MAYRNGAVAQAGPVTITSALNASDQAKLDRTTFPEPEAFALTKAQLEALQKLVPNADGLASIPELPEPTETGPTGLGIVWSRLRRVQPGLPDTFSWQASYVEAGTTPAVGGYVVTGADGKIDPSLLPSTAAGVTAAAFAAFTAANTAELADKYDKAGGTISGDVIQNDGTAVSHTLVDPRYPTAPAAGYQRHTTSGQTIDRIVNAAGTTVARNIRSVDHGTGDVLYTSAVGFQNGIAIGATTLSAAELAALKGAGGAAAGTWKTSGAGVLLSGTQAFDGDVTLPAVAAGAKEVLLSAVSADSASGSAAVTAIAPGVEAYLPGDAVVGGGFTARTVTGNGGGNAITINASGSERFFLEVEGGKFKVVVSGNTAFPVTNGVATLTLVAWR